MAKKAVRKLLVLASALMLLCSSACTQETQDTETSAETTAEAADVILIQNKKTDYKLIYGTSSLKNTRSSASDLAGLFLNNCGIIMSVNDAEETPAAMPSATATTANIIEISLVGLNLLNILPPKYLSTL